MSERGTDDLPPPLFRQLNDSESDGDGDVSNSNDDDLSALQQRE